MIYLILTILLTASFFILFRVFALYKLNVFQAIVTNYIVCVPTGLIFSGDLNPARVVSFEETWIYIAFLIGGIFLLTFYLMAYTVAKISVTVSTVANKTSLIIPVLFSIFVFKTRPEEGFTFLNYCGIALGIIGIILSSVKKEQHYFNPDAKYLNFLLPLLVFVLGGAVDTLLNYVNLYYLTEAEQKVFPIVTFFAAGVVGLLIVAYRVISGMSRIDFKSIIGGIALGIPNYFSIYFVLRSLEAYNNNGSFVFPVVNVGIIILSSLLAVVFFKEKLIPANITGVLMAIFSIILLFW